MQTFDETRPTHEQSLRAQITRLESLNADLLAACKAALVDAMLGACCDDPSHGTPLARQLRAAIRLAESVRKEGAK